MGLNLKLPNPLKVLVRHCLECSLDNVILILKKYYRANTEKFYVNNV